MRPVPSPAQNTRSRHTNHHLSIHGNNMGNVCAAAMFLMWEVSTPCVYARWFLAHIGRHNTRLYIANGLAMLATFFVARNCLGLCVSPLRVKQRLEIPIATMTEKNPILS